MFAFLERVTNTLNDLENHPWERIFKDNIEMNIENEINGFGGYFKDHPKFTGLILGDFEYGVNKYIYCCIYYTVFESGVYCIIHC